jgi:hypothetical protein
MQTPLINREINIDSQVTCIVHGVKKIQHELPVREETSEAS